MPHSSFHLGWDFASAGILFVILIYVPYDVAFVADDGNYQQFDVFVFVWFAVDICVESQPIQDTFNLSVPERILGLSLSSRRELGERIRTVQESWETSSI